MGAGIGAIAQLGERLLCKQEVVGSIPSGSTKLRLVEPADSLALPCSLRCAGRLAPRRLAGWPGAKVLVGRKTRFADVRLLRAFAGS